MTNTIRAFLVLFFFGLLTACGGGGGTSAMTMTQPDNPGTTEPVTLTVESPELGAVHLRGPNQRHLMLLLSVNDGGEDKDIFGRTISFQRGMLAPLQVFGQAIPTANTATLHANGDVIQLVENETPVFQPVQTTMVLIQTNLTINNILALCNVPYLRRYVTQSAFFINCPSAAGLSYTPNMPNVLHAAMADTFHRGIGIGESRFAFSGRHNGNDRAAGFTYDMGGYALRTDYVHLPSKQDSGVFLDTYRFGIVRPINDETRFFAGVDSYRNAIFAIDTNGKNLHRFGIAAGDGYAVRYEYRIRL